MVSGSDDCTLRVWNVKENTCIRTIIAHNSWIYQLEFIEEENLLVSGAGDGTVKFWNLDLDNPIIYNAHLN